MGLITLIAGPPCAGKTTLANSLAESGDTILDFDRIAVRLGSPRPWNHPAPFIAAANQQVQLQLEDLRDRDDVTAWVIRAAPRPGMREGYARALNARVWVLDPGLAVCLQRARRRPYGTDREIRKWYRSYAPSPVDERPSSTATTSSEESS